MNLTGKILVTATLLFLAACNNSNPTRTPQQDTIAKVQPLIPDTIAPDKTIFPIDTLLNVKLLTTGFFHEDEVWPAAGKERWFGLFKGKDSCYIQETSVITKRVNDPLLDDDRQKTAWEVTATNSDETYLLIEALPYLGNRKIEEGHLARNVIYPGDTAAFTYLGTSYKLFATGSKKKYQSDPDEYEVWNYKLFITAKKDGHELTQLLVAKPNFEDNMIDIIFAGDIDGDGFLDMVIDVSWHYNMLSPVLYLSKPAAKDQLIKPVGIHSSFGC